LEKVGLDLVHWSPPRYGASNSLIDEKLQPSIRFSTQLQPHPLGSGSLTGDRQLFGNKTWLVVVCGQLPDSSVNEREANDPSLGSTCISTLTAGVCLMTTGSERLAGKVAIVTGGGRGLGRSMVLGLVRAGASVVATAACETAEIEQVAHEAEEMGYVDRIHPLTADVTQEEDCVRTVEAALSVTGADWGAGIPPDGHP
jgi:short chain dehydrogenase